MKEDISRRPRADKACRPFYRIAVDIIQLQEHGKACYNGDVWALHAVCEYTKLHEICTLKDRHKTTVVPALIRLINKIEKVYSYQVAIVFMDGDVGYGRAEANLGSSAKEMLASAGIKVEVRSPDTPAQLGGAERAGAIIVTVSRVLRIHAGLPKSLANELVCTAARILNITPTKSIDWRTPQEMVTGVRPDLSRLRVIGSRGFVLNKHLPEETNLKTAPLKDSLLDTTLRTSIESGYLPRVELSVYEMYASLMSFTRRSHQHHPWSLALSRRSTFLRRNTMEIPLSWRSLYDNDRKQSLRLSYHQIMYLKRSMMVTLLQCIRSLFANSSLHLLHPLSKDKIEVLLEQQLLGVLCFDGLISTGHLGWNNYDDDAEIYIPDRHQNNAPQRRDPNLSQDNIITGRRRRQAHYIEAAPDLSKYFAFSATIAQANDAISAASQPTRSDPTRIHRDDLPPPPRHWKELKRHAHGKQFEAAAYAEFNSCWKKGTFAKPDITADTTDAVPLMWVFTYKFDEDGYLFKYKARLVVRGDLQEQYGDTYAATLAARLFRALMALACAFNLKAMQYDVPNAFLNANMDRTLYVRTPDGFQDRYGPNLRLLRALYGLKSSSPMGYSLPESLRKLGLHPVQGFPCLWMNNRIILFFFVDDIIILCHQITTWTLTSLNNNSLSSMAFVR
ncbi:hypothetical protein P3342_001671 [Pyrenophora teres f. teres]|nr:hypothetical protein P3342_001671 [Pyrenophora teres f. teres]